MSYGSSKYQNGYVKLLRGMVVLMNTTDNVALSTDTGYRHW